MSEPTVKDIMLRHANNEVPLAIDRRILIKHIEQLQAQLDKVRELLELDATDGAIVFASGDKAIYMEDLRQALQEKDDG